MFCEKCGSKINEETKACSNCEINNTTEMKTAESSNYPKRLIKPTAGKALFFWLLVSILFCTLFIGSFVKVYFIWLAVFTLLSYASISQLIKNLGLLNRDEYVVRCPSCDMEFGFPTDSLGVECPKCNKRTIIKDNKIQIVNNGN